MNVSNVVSSNLTSRTMSVSSARSSDPSATSSASSVEGPPPPPNAEGISKGGEMMKKLSDLAASDPSRFKEVTGQIASKLKTLAGSQGGKASPLNELAGKFESASTSGTMDALKPSGPPPGQSMARGAHAYAQNAATGTNPMRQIDQIFESALSGVSS